jgi:hypothetical protein
MPFGFEPEEMVAAGVATAAGNDACFSIETPLFKIPTPARTMPEFGDSFCALHHTSEKRDGDILCSRANARATSLHVTLS